MKFLGFAPWLVHSLLFLSASPVQADSPLGVQFSEQGTGLSADIALVPNGTNTDIWLQVSAPQQAGWGAVGIGSQMAGSLMFIIYPGTAGDDVTVSLRTATGEFEPSAIDNYHIGVNGTAIKNGQMYANFICYNCAAWTSSTISLDKSSTSQSWVWAIGPGIAVSSDSDNASINQHLNSGTFSADMTKAQVSAASAAFPALTSTAASPATSSGGSSSNSGTASTSTSTGINYNMLVAHATLLCLVFYALLPIGVWLLRVPSAVASPGSPVVAKCVMMHYITQLVAFALAIAGLAIGVSMSMMAGLPYSTFDNYHQVVGLIAICGLLLQTILGLVHHLLFKRTQKRTIWSYFHMTLGWTLMILGCVNGILGFVWRAYPGAAGGLAVLGVVMLVSTAAIVVLAGRRRRSRQTGVTPPHKGSVKLQDMSASGSRSS